MAIKSWFADAYLSPASLGEIDSEMYAWKTLRIHSHITLKSWDEILAFKQLCTNIKTTTSAYLFKTWNAKTTSLAYLAITNVVIQSIPSEISCYMQMQMRRMILNTHAQEELRIEFVCQHMVGRKYLCISKYDLPSYIERVWVWENNISLLRTFSSTMR